MSAHDTQPPSSTRPALVLRPRLRFSTSAGTVANCKASRRHREHRGLARCVTQGGRFSRGAASVTGRSGVRNRRRVPPARPRQDVWTYSVFKFLSLLNAPGWISLILLKRRSLWRNQTGTQGTSEATAAVSLGNVRCQTASRHVRNETTQPTPVNHLRPRLLSTAIYLGDRSTTSPSQGFKRLLRRDDNYVHCPPSHRPPAGGRPGVAVSYVIATA